MGDDGSHKSKVTWDSRLSMRHVKHGKNIACDFIIISLVCVSTVQIMTTLPNFFAGENMF